MLIYFCLLTALVGGSVASPPTYGLPLPTKQTFSKETFLFQGTPTTPLLSDFSSQSGQFANPINSFQTYPRSQVSNPISQNNNVFSSNFQSPQSLNPAFQSNSQTNFAFQRNQFSSPGFQSGSSVQSDYPQAHTTPFQNNQFNRPPVRSGLENHPFLHGNTLELLPPLQHVVGTKYPRVEAGTGYRFPLSQLLNTTPPPNLL